MSKKYTLGDLSFQFNIGDAVRHRADNPFLPIRLIILGRAQMEEEGGVVQNLYLVSYVKPNADGLGQFGRHYLYEQELQKYQATVP